MNIKQLKNKNTFNTMPVKRWKATKKRMDIIVNHLSKLSGRVASAEAGGITYHTFLKWMENIPEFREAVEKAEAETLERGKAVAIQAIFKAMDKNWAAAGWWLERNHPEIYAKIDHINMDVTSKNVSFTIGITDPTLQIADTTQQQIEETIKKLNENNSEEENNM